MSIRIPRAVVVALLAVLLGAAAILLLVNPGGGTALAKRVGALQMVTQSYRLTDPNQTQRLSVECPGRQVPLGGGMTSNPAPSADGEGAYPQSYEPLGVQSGWHITAVLFDPSGDNTTPVTSRCRSRVGGSSAHVTPPHNTVREPGPDQDRRRHLSRAGVLFAGGYQRTDFVSGGGDYVTESRRSRPSLGVSGARIRRLRRKADRDRLLLARPRAADPRSRLRVRRSGASAPQSRRPARQAEPRLRRLQHDARAPPSSRTACSTPTAPGPPRPRTSGSAATVTAYGYCLKV